MAHRVELRQVEPQQTATIRDKVARKEIEMRLADLIVELEEYLDQQGIEGNGRPFARYHNFDPIERIDVDLEVGLPVPQEVASTENIVPSTLPGCQAATLRYQGPYDEIERAYEIIEEWIENHDYESAGTPWESYLTDLSGRTSTDEWEVEISWPVKSD